MRLGASCQPTTHSPASSPLCSQPPFPLFAGIFLLHAFGLAAGYLLHLGGAVKGRLFPPKPSAEMAIEAAIAAAEARISETDKVPGKDERIGITLEESGLARLRVEAVAGQARSGLRQTCVIPSLPAHANGTHNCVSQEEALC